MSCCLRACQDSRFVTCFLCMSCLGMRFVFVDVKIRDSWQVLVHVILFSCMSRFALRDMFLCMSCHYLLCFCVCQNSWLLACLFFVHVISRHVLCLRACQDSRFVTCFCAVMSLHSLSPCMSRFAILHVQESFTRIFHESWYVQKLLSGILICTP